ncbi:MAG: NotI family restriction endonuclease [Methylococcales bacterium]
MIKIAITCPIRFRQDWLIAEDAAKFFFPRNTSWTSLTEVRLRDGNGQSAGNIDVVLVAYDANGKITDFGSLEVQAVYISGNVRNPFEHYMRNHRQNADVNWDGPNYPRADYLSSSRKRLAPQKIYKGGIFKQWNKKQAVALHKSFYATLPELPDIKPEQAEIAWLLYDLHFDETINRFRLVRDRTVYTAFGPALLKITTAPAGSIEDFLTMLQTKLDERLSNAPVAPTLQDMLSRANQ